MIELAIEEVMAVSGADQAPSVGAVQTPDGGVVVVATCPSGTEVQATRNAEGGVTITCVSE